MDRSLAGYSFMCIIFLSHCKHLMRGRLILKHQANLPSKSRWTGIQAGVEPNSASGDLTSCPGLTACTSFLRLHVVTGLKHKFVLL